MQGLAFTIDEIRRALAACTPLCKCQDCEESREESEWLLVAYLNALLLDKLRRKGQQAD